jgi:25S rRNA (adenine2142-N1)-methyltransferase
MLRLAWNFLLPGGHLFLAVSNDCNVFVMLLTSILQLPLPCVTNSRYLTCERLTALMEVLGFFQVKERWKAGGKMIYLLYQKIPTVGSTPEPFTKKAVLRQGDRNNFSILL